jgi:hypothetical protein
MEIISGLAAVKTATDLARAWRDAVKAGSIPPDQLTGRIAEVYDYILDSKESVLAAHELVLSLTAENQRLKNCIFSPFGELANPWRRR